jgi:hypothetical protein
LEKIGKERAGKKESIERRYEELPIGSHYLHVGHRRGRAG